MTDRITFGVIGFLVAIIMMQAGVTSQKPDNVLTVPAAMAGPIVGTTGIIAAADDKFLDEHGQVWWLDSAYVEGGWQAFNFGVPLPVTLSQIKFWQRNVIITTDNIAWVLDTNSPPPFVWENLGPWPGGPVPANENTWGSTKIKFKGQQD